MKRNRIQYSAWLKIPPEQATKKLEDCENSGTEVKNAIDIIYNSKRNDKIPKNIINKHKRLFEQWGNDCLSILDEIYVDESYKKRFMIPQFEEDWFELTREILKANMIESRRDDIRFKYRLEKADQNERIVIEREIIRDIGSLESHWSFEKSRMITHLENTIESRLGYLVDRISYLMAFGGNPMLIPLEFPCIDASNRIRDLLKNEPFATIISNDDRFRITFEKYEKGEIDVKSAFKMAGIELLKVPRKLQFDLENRTLLLIRPKGEGIMTDTFSGLGWDHKKHIEIFNKVNQIRYEYEQSFHGAFSTSISQYAPAWDTPFPVYDKDNIRGSFIDVGTYLVEFEYLIRNIPNILLSHPDFKRFNYSDNYKIVEIDGIEFVLGEHQRIVIRYMHTRAIEGKNFPIPGGTILQSQKIRTKNNRIGNIFRDHQAIRLLHNNGKQGWRFNPEYL